MVALDAGGAGAAAGLDDVRVQRALHQELDVVLGFDLAGRLLEHPDELPPDDLALLLRVGDARECVQEPAGRVHHLELDPGGGDVVLLDLFGLAGPQQPMVHEHAGELVAHGAVHERRRDRRIHPAGQPADHLLVADRGADRRHLLVDDRVVRPGRLDAGDVVQEPPEHLLAVRGVRHLRVELHPGQPPAAVLELQCLCDLLQGCHRYVSVRIVPNTAYRVIIDIRHSAQF